MSMKVIFHCNGCFKDETVELPPREFITSTGKSWGFGFYKYPQVKDHAPEGWMAYDAYTGMTYCPDCSEGLEAA